MTIEGAVTKLESAHNVHTIAEPPARTNGPHHAPRDITCDGGYRTRRIRYAVPISSARRGREVREWADDVRPLREQLGAIGLIARLEAPFASWPDAVATAPPTARDAASTRAPA